MPKLKSGITDNELTIVEEFMKLRAQNWRIELLPKSYDNKSVLDIGGEGGFYSFDAEDKGAIRVVVTDWTFNPIRTMALKIYDTKVEEKIINVYDMDEMTEQFDVVIFMGVLYHLKHPILGLEKAYNRLKDNGEFYLETLIYSELGDNAMVVEFIEDSRYNNDPSNWWAPTIEATKAMMRSVKLKNVELILNHSGRGFFKGMK